MRTQKRPVTTDATGRVAVEDQGIRAGQKGQVGVGRNLAGTRAGGCLRLDGATIGSGIKPGIDH